MKFFGKSAFSKKLCFYTKLDQTTCIFFFYDIHCEMDECKSWPDHDLMGFLLSSSYHNFCVPKWWSIMMNLSNCGGLRAANAHVLISAAETEIDSSTHNGHELHFDAPFWLISKMKKQGPYLNGLTRPRKNLPNYRARPAFTDAGNRDCYFQLTT